MLEIRPAVRNDVDLLRTLIHEMGEYERLPVSITAETLARDGFGPRPEFRVLIADLDNQPAGYAFFFNCYSTFRGRGLFLEDLFVRPKSTYAPSQLTVAKCAQFVQPYVDAESN